MATVYSLICFGGRTGKTVTFTDSGDVVNLTNNGLRAGTGVVFSTTGSLPTGLTSGTTYYAAPGADINKFLLYPTKADAIARTNQVTFSGTGSGTHTVKSATMLGLFAAYSGRWGASGSERCYDGIASMLTARNSAASRVDPEVIEFGEAFTEYATYSIILRVGSCPYTLYTSSINGVRTTAFHGGIIGHGYINLVSNYGHETSSLTDVDGLTFEHASNTAVGTVFRFSGLRCSVLNNIFIGKSTTSGSDGIVVQSGLANLQRNLIIGFTDGISNYDSGGAGLIAFNTISKCGNGIQSQNDSLTYRYSTWVNNISVGNNVNWRVQPTTLEFASGNVGESGDTIWTTTGGTSVVMAESDFADYANNDFRPASATSPQVDSAIPVYGESVTDIADAEVPNYNNGGLEGADIGAFEYDHGYGPHPASYNLTLTGLQPGVEVRCYVGVKDGTATEVGGTESLSGTSFTLTHGVGGQPGFIRVISTDYKIIDLDYTYATDDTSIPMNLGSDPWFNNPA